MSIPISAQGSWSGSLLETTLICFPSTLMVSLSTILTSALKVPSIESYFSKCDACNFNVNEAVNFFYFWTGCQVDWISSIANIKDPRTHILNTTTVIDNNNFKWRVLASMPATKEIPANASKTIDCYLQFGNCFSSNRGWSWSLMSDAGKNMSQRYGAECIK